MRKLPLALAVLASLSAPLSYAQTNDQVTQSKNQFYAGVDLEFAGSAKASLGNAKIEDNSDIGFSVVGGYEFSAHKQVKPSLELEYRNFGNTSYSTLSVDANAFFVNAKAKLFVLYDFGNVYLAPMIGVGIVNLDVKESSLNMSESESESAFQAGIEIGTRLANNIDLNLGYKAAYTEIDAVDITLDGFYIGARYAF
ncbi:outer membrane beta-barrel protein [Vibrio scophthalmi]|uniref:Outer membrane protein beta-barrel domain-containing protein n=1 Tax=Vibrio scophthalmi TaxID=45658 RepID=A0A1C7FGP2_9VIBR|nr:outer membrane beta-barrel protein [Vibrio scophthalmi]ANU39102.1 hypothetical protein VSVS05_04066 [Vibrio scophthalmi]